MAIAISHEHTHKHTEARTHAQAHTHAYTARTHTHTLTHTHTIGGVHWWSIPMDVLFYPSLWGFYYSLCPPLIFSKYGWFIHKQSLENMGCTLPMIKCLAMPSIFGSPLIFIGIFSSWNMVEQTLHMCHIKIRNIHFHLLMSIIIPKPI